MTMGREFTPLPRCLDACAAFAVREAIVVLATIVKHFVPTPLPQHKVWPLPRVTSRPEGGLPMTVRPRRAA